MEMKIKALYDVDGIRHCVSLRKRNMYNSTVSGMKVFQSEMNAHLRHANGERSA